MAGQRQVFEVDGMTCGGCEAGLSRALSQVAGVQAVSIRRAEKRVEVTGAAPAEAVLRAIAQAGYMAKQAA